MSFLFKDNNYALRLIILIFVSCFIIYSNYIFGDVYFVFKDLGADTYHGYLPFIFSGIDFFEKASLYSFNISIGSYSLLIKQIFDPFNWVLFLFSKEYTLSLIIWIVILKHIFAGVFFYLYLKRLKFNLNIVFLIAYAYGLSGYIMVWGQHYHYGTFFVFFTAYLYFFESYLESGKKIGLFIVLFLSFSLSLLFTYVLILFTIVYGTIRIFQMQKSFFRISFRLSVIFIISFLLCLWIVFPDIINILQSPRTSSKEFSLFSIFEFTANIEEHILVSILRFFSNDLLGIGVSLSTKIDNYYSIPVLYSSIFVLFLFILGIIIAYKKNKLNIFLIGIMIFVVLLVNKFFILLLNGFNNDYFFRYSIFYTFPIYVAAAYALEYLYESTNRERLIVYLFLLVLLISSFFLFYSNYSIKDYNNFHLYILIGCIIFLTSYFLIFINEKKIKNNSLKFLTFFLFFELIISAYLSVNYNRLNLNKTTIEQDKYFDKDIKSLINNEKNEPYRVLNNFSSLNAGMMYGYSGLNSYLSLNNADYMNFLKSFEQYNYLGHPNFIRLESKRITLMELLGVKYIIDRNNIVGMNSNVIHKDKRKIIYKLDNEFFKFYAECIDSASFSKLNYLDKENLIKKYCIKDKTNFQKDILNQYKTSIESNISPTLKNLKIINKWNYESTNDDPMLIYKLAEINSNSVKVNFDAKFDKVGTLLIYYRNKNEVFSNRQRIALKTKKGWSSYTVHILEENIDSIRIDPLNWKDKFSIKNTEFEMFYQKYVDIKYNSFNKVDIKYNKFEDDRIEFVINLKEDGIIFAPILFDKDWKVYINNERKEIYKLNHSFIGFDIKKGEQKVVLKYEPKLIYYLFYSSLSILAFLLTYSFFKKRMGND